MTGRLSAKVKTAFRVYNRFQMTQLHELTACEQARLIRTGEISSAELTRHYLARIGKHNPDLGGVVETLATSALLEAGLRDAQLRQGYVDPGPLFGVPTGVKDLEFVRFSHTRYGAKPLRWIWTPFDGMSAKALRAAGMVILAKTATSELGIMPITETYIHPPARNPWNRNHTSGGSSGGAGASVAGGLLPVAHGSDGAGSIRIPAALCGLFGYKPSRKFLLDPYERYDLMQMATIGPLGRSMEDIAVFADTLLGPEQRATGTSLDRARHQRPPRLRIRYLTSSPIGPLDAPYIEDVQRVAKVCEALGHDVAEASPTQGTLEEFLPIYMRQCANAEIPFESSLQPVSRWMRQEGKKIHQSEADALFAEIIRRTESVWQDADIWLTPSTAMQAPAVGHTTHMSGQQAFHHISPLGAFTAVFNITGQPAITIPVAFDPQGLPRGVQIVARIHRDPRLFAVAQQVVEAMNISFNLPDPLQ